MSEGMEERGQDGRRVVGEKGRGGRKEKGRGRGRRREGRGKVGPLEL